MPIVINTNMNAIIARQAMENASLRMSTSLQRLSTGYKINSSADDPAGSYYAAKLNTQLNGMRSAYANVQLGFNIAQTAEGDLQSINDELERIKDLATQRSSDTVSDKDKESLLKEAKSRLEEINRLAKDSSFGDLKLLDGSLDKGSGVRIQVGGNSDPTTNAIRMSGVFTNATVGALNLFADATTSTGFASIEDAFAYASTAAKFIDIVDKAVKGVQIRISDAGIYENRLQSIQSSLNVKYENYTAAYSTVMDADIATETANYTKYMILQQTASTMLAQANQMTSLALTLLPK